MVSSYEVIISGGGPAGAILGYELACKGIDVQLLEKEKFPRYKPCAGGITVRAAGILGFDLGDLVRQPVNGICAMFRGKPSFTKDYDEPIAYTVMRDEFDACLLDRASRAGAKVRQDCAVRQVDIGPDGYLVRTSQGNLHCRYLAGADGAKSPVARALGLTKKVQYGTGIVTEVSPSPDKVAKLGPRMLIELGRLPGGYGWVFPKGDHVSAGIGGRERQAGRLKSHLGMMLKDFDLNGEDYTTKGHLLPVAGRNPTLHAGKALLVGDAAGLVDPCTGEGIHNAVKSARLAAAAIQQCIRQNQQDLMAYQDMISADILPELRAARSLARLFGWFPGTCTRAIRDHDRLWRASCRLLRGEETYITLKKRLGILERPFDMLGSW